jgi:hypothetical protein
MMDLGWVRWDIKGFSSNFWQKRSEKQRYTNCSLIGSLMFYVQISTHTTYVRLRKADTVETAGSFGH